MIDYGEAINELAQEINDVCISKGFWDDPYDLENALSVPAKLALITSEVSEALEVNRNRYDDGEEDIFTDMTPMQEDDFTEELADIIIRVLDLAAELDLNIGRSLLTKIETNRLRPAKHGKKY